MLQESLPVSLWIVLPVWDCRTLGGKKRYKYTILGESIVGCVGSPSFPGAEPWVSEQQLYVQMLLKQSRIKRVLDSSPGREFYLSWEGHHSEASLVASYSLLWPFCCLTEIPVFIFHHFLLVDLRSFPTSWVLTACFTLHIIKPFQILFQKSHP